MKAQDFAQVEPGYKFLGGWIPEESPATVALVWQVTFAAQTSYRAEIQRDGQTTRTLKEGTLPALAKQLIKTCGMSRRSIVRLGVVLPDGKDSIKAAPTRPRGSRT